MVLEDIKPAITERELIILALEKISNLEKKIDDFQCDLNKVKDQIKTDKEKHDIAIANLNKWFLRAQGAYWLIMAFIVCLGAIKGVI